MSLLLHQVRASHAVKTQMIGGNEWAILAGLRFLLALLVVILHCGNVAISLPFWAATARLFSDAAVPGFFAISGYSIAHSLRNGSQGFYRRRIERIAPVYLASLLFALVPFFVYGHAIHIADGEVVHAPSALLVIENALGLQGYLCKPILSIYWTLAIECGCYAFAPLFARTNSRVLLFLIALSSMLFMCRFALHVDAMSQLYGLGIMYYLWNWLAGFLFYRYRDSYRARLGLVVYGPFMMLIHPAGFPKSAALFATVLTILAWSHLIRLPALASKWLGTWGAYSGEVSYPLYLVHIPILILVAGSAQPNQPPHLPGGDALLISVAVAIMVYHAIDAPFRRLARKRTQRFYFKEAPVPQSKLL